MSIMRGVILISTFILAVSRAEREALAPSEAAIRAVNQHQGFRELAISDKGNPRFLNAEPGKSQASNRFKSNCFECAAKQNRKFCFNDMETSKIWSHWTGHCCEEDDKNPECTTRDFDSHSVTCSTGTYKELQHRYYSFCPHALETNYCTDSDE